MAKMKAKLEGNFLYVHDTKGKLRMFNANLISQIYQEDADKVFVITSDGLMVQIDESFNNVTNVLTNYVADEGGMGEYNKLWMDVISKVEQDNVSAGEYSKTVLWLQNKFKIAKKS